jgi:hypothetical protein
MLGRQRQPCQHHFRLAANDYFETRHDIREIGRQLGKRNCRRKEQGRHPGNH